MPAVSLAGSEAGNQNVKREKDEHRTSNVQHRMLNNDVALLFKLLPDSHVPAQEPIWYAFPRWSMGTRKPATSKIPSNKRGGRGAACRDGRKHGGTECAALVGSQD